MEPNDRTIAGRKGLAFGKISWQHPHLSEQHSESHEFLIRDNKLRLRSEVLRIDISFAPYGDHGSISQRVSQIFYWIFFVLILLNDTIVNLFRCWRRTRYFLSFDADRPSSFNNYRVHIENRDNRVPGMLPVPDIRHTHIAASAGTLEKNEKTRLDLIWHFSINEECYSLN